MLSETVHKLVGSAAPIDFVVVFYVGLVSAIKFPLKTEAHKAI